MSGNMGIEDESMMKKSGDEISTVKNVGMQRKISRGTVGSGGILQDTSFTVIN